MTGPLPGPLAEEARQLAAAVAGWARQYAAHVPVARTGPPPQASDPATADPSKDPWASATATRPATTKDLSTDPWAAATATPPAADPWAAATRAPANDPGAAAECRYCPVCQVIALLRGDRPEAAARLVSAGGALAEALRTVFAPPAGGPTPDPPPDDPPVQHIRVD